MTSPNTDKKETALHPHTPTLNHPHKDDARLDAAVQVWVISLMTLEGATQGRAV